jgi:hypothetical protein
MPFDTAVVVMVVMVMVVMVMVVMVMVVYRWFGIEEK